MWSSGDGAGSVNTVLWDAERYERQPLPHEGWGAGVIRRAGLRAGDSLVDAGCGTGRDAELALNVLARLAETEGVALGVLTLLDADADMIEASRKRFGGYPEGQRPVILQADLVEPWPVAVPADVIISVASLHWIGDHTDVFREAAAVGTDQARLHVDCGGAGNIETVVDAATRVGLPMPEWNFATVDATASALRAGGWEPQDVWLHADPLVLPDRATFREFLQSVMFHHATEALLDDMVEACPETVVDYVRLNIDAQRA